MDTSHHKANLYSISITTKIASNLPPLLCAANQIKQAIMNLIKNSIEAMATGGSIVLNAKTSPEGIEVSVVDDGPGIPEERLRNLGEPFYTTKDRGTGLGLMVTYRIIQKHGGTVKVSSETGKGTRFELFLPIAGA